MARAPLAAALAPLLVLALLATHASAQLAAAEEELRLLPGSRVDGYRLALRGELEEGGVRDCSVDAVFARDFAGIAVNVEGASCRVAGGRVTVSVVASLTGVYTGEGGEWRPVRARLSLLMEDGSTRTVYVDSEPIRVEPVEVASLRLSRAGEPTLSYTPGRPGLGETVIFSLVAPAEARVTLSAAPTVPATLTLRVSSPQGFQVESTFKVSSKEVVVRLPERLPTGVELRYELSTEGAVLAEGEASVPGPRAYAVVVVNPPVQTVLQGEWRIYGSASVAAIEGGRLEFAMRVDKVEPEGRLAGGEARASTTEPGVVKVYVRLRGPVSSFQGSYTLTFTAAGERVSIVVPFGGRDVAGSVASLVPLLLYVVLGFGVMAGFASLTIGSLARSPALFLAGVQLVGLTVMVIAGISVVAGALALLARAGFPDPIGFQGVNINNLGEKFEAAIAYVPAVAQSIVAYLQDVIGIATGVVATVAILLAIFGLHPGVAEVLGAVFRQVLRLLLLSLIVKYLLSAVALIYPILITATLVILFLFVALTALAAVFTGDASRFSFALVRLVTFLFLVLVAPSIIAPLEELRVETVLASFTIPVVDVTVTIPSPTSLAVAVVSLPLIIMVMALAFYWLISTLNQV